MTLERLSELSRVDKAIVMFGYPGCSYCVKIKAAAFPSLASTHGAKFYYVDIQAQPLNRVADLKGLPTFVAFTNGVEHGRIVGGDENQLMQFVGRFGN